MADLSQDDPIITEISSNNTPAIIGGDDRLTISPDLTDANGDGIMEPSGTLTISDPDSGEAAFISGPIQGEYGLFFIQESGFWSYASDTQQEAILALGPNESVTEVITVTTVDGTTHDVIFTIYGANDAPSDLDLSNLKVVEDVDGVIIGDLSVTDNQGDYHSYTVSDNRFEVVNGQLKLKDGVSFNRSTASEAEITITATDQHGASYSENFILTTFSPYEEQLVNTTTDGSQRYSQITALSDGGYVVAWDSYSASSGTWDVMLQRYDGHGSPVGDELTVRSGLSGNQYLADIIASGDGGFVVGFGSNHSGSMQYYTQRYDANTEESSALKHFPLTNDQLSTPESVRAYFELQSLGGEDYFVNLRQVINGRHTIKWGVVDGNDAFVRYETGGGSNGYFGDVSLAILSDGQMVSVSESDYGDSHIYRVYFDTNTFVNTRPGDVVERTAGEQFNPSVAALDSGGYIITWQSTVGDNSGSSIWAQAYNNSHQKVGAKVLVNTVATGNQVTPQIVTYGPDKYMIIWNSYENNNWDIKGQVLDSSGNKVGAEFFVTDTLSGNQYIISKPVETSDGTIVVTWHDNSSGSNEIKSKHIEPYNTPAIIGGDDRLTISPDLTDANGDGIMEPSGTLTISDPDAGEAAFISGPIQGEYGLFFIQESGFWSYASDTQQEAILALGLNESLTEVITVTTVDGTTHDVIFTIYGANDAPSGIDLSNLKVVEDVDGVIIGDLSVTDNQGDYHSYTVSDNRFEVVNGQLKLKDGVSFNRSTASEAEITITATDQHGASYSEDFILTTFSPYEEQLVNTTIEGHQRYSQITALSDGGYVVAWDSYSASSGTWDVMLQRYDGHGSPVGDELTVRSGLSGNQYLADIIASGDGGFVVGFGSNHSGSMQYYTQRYDANTEESSVLKHFPLTNDQLSTPQSVRAYFELQSLDGEDYFVNLRQVINGRYDITWGAVDGNDAFIRYETGDGSTGFWGDESIAILSDGQLVSVSGHDYYGNDFRIYRIYFETNTFGSHRPGDVVEQTAGEQSKPSIAALDSGGYIITWQSTVGDNSGSSIWAQAYNNSHQKVGAKVLVNTVTTGNQVTPHIVTYGPDKYMIIWNSYENNNWDIKAQVLDSSGNKVGEEFFIADTLAGNQYIISKPVETSNGNIVVTWNDNSSGSDEIKSKHIEPYNTPAIIGGDDRLTISPDLTDANGDGIMEPSGTLTISDPDAGEAAFISGPIQGEYGLFFIQESGFWSYASDTQQEAILALGPNDSVTEVITVTTVDGTTHDVIFTIYGAEETSEFTALSNDLTYSSESDDSLSLAVIKAPKAIENIDLSHLDEMGVFDSLPFSHDDISV